MTLNVESTGQRIAVISLDAPKVRNALTAEMRTALQEALPALARDPDIDAVIIRGAGGNFSAGGDVRTMGETDRAKIDQRMNDVARTALMLARFPKPVIAAVEGHAAGGGVSLACLCDVIVADEEAQFTFSHLRIALCPDWGLSFTLPRRVGAAAARRLILSAARLDGEAAAKIGLVDVLAASGEVQETAAMIAADFAAGAIASVGSVKALLADSDGLAAALDAETALQRDLFPAPEHQEGAKAFLEKRRPDFIAARQKAAGHSDS